MRVVTVPNWSFGRDASLLRAFRDCFPSDGISLHYLETDIDHNRTVTAFAGEAELVFAKLRQLCDLAFDRIDLNRHVGVHPRIGALDVCPFVALPEWDVPFAQLDREVQRLANDIATAYEIPIFLYERSEKGRHEADLPSLRKGGFGGLIGVELHPDYGPRLANSTLGVSIIGIRDFLIAMNVNLATEELMVARELARRIRTLRLDGDERFLGVRALGFPLTSRSMTQVSINVTLPDLTAVDPIIEWVQQNALEADVKVAGSELIGIIRQKDLSGASRLPINPSQVVDQVGKANL
jgi:glutamate formiminotransferase